MGFRLRKNDLNLLATLTDCRALTTTQIAALHSFLAAIARRNPFPLISDGPSALPSQNCCLSIRQPSRDSESDIVDGMTFEEIPRGTTI